MAWLRTAKSENDDSRLGSLYLVGIVHPTFILETFKLFKLEGIQSLVRTVGPSRLIGTHVILKE